MSLESKGYPARNCELVSRPWWCKGTCKKKGCLGRRRCRFAIRKVTPLELSGLADMSTTLRGRSAPLLTSPSHHCPALSASPPQSSGPPPRESMQRHSESLAPPTERAFESPSEGGNSRPHFDSQGLCSRAPNWFKKRALTVACQA